MTEAIVYWSCKDPEKYALGREYRSEYTALQGAILRDEYVVRVSYSLCSSKIIRTPKTEAK